MTLRFLLVVIAGLGLGCDPNEDKEEHVTRGRVRQGPTVKFETSPDSSGYRVRGEQGAIITEDGQPLSTYVCARSLELTDVDQQDGNVVVRSSEDEASAWSDTEGRFQVDVPGFSSPFVLIGVGVECDGVFAKTREDLVSLTILHRMSKQVVPFAMLLEGLREFPDDASVKELSLSDNDAAAFDCPGGSASTPDPIVRHSFFPRELKIVVTRSCLGVRDISLDADQATRAKTALANIRLWNPLADFFFESDSCRVEGGPSSLVVSNSDDVRARYRLSNGPGCDDRREDGVGFAVGVDAWLEFVESL